METDKFKKMGENETKSLVIKDMRLKKHSMISSQTYQSR